MLCRFRRVWVAGLLLAALPLAAAAQVGFGFGFRYRNAKYDGRVALVRARYQAYPGWSYDYPAMENNLAQVLHDITTLRPNLQAADILDFDDPQLFRYPLVYLSEPGYWMPTATEAEGLRTYLQKGGFLIVDDFHYPNEWAVFEAAIRRVLPAGRIYRLDASHSIYNSFFAIKSLEIPYPGMSGPRRAHGRVFRHLRGQRSAKEHDGGDQLQHGPRRLSRVVQRSEEPLLARPRPTKRTSSWSTTCYTASVIDGAGGSSTGASAKADLPTGALAKVDLQSRRRRLQQRNQLPLPVGRVDAVEGHLQDAIFQVGAGRRVDR